MNAKDNYIFEILKWFITTISITIAIPSVFKEDTQIAFILTTCVIIFSKFIENIENIGKYPSRTKIIFSIIGTFLSVIAIGLCFYYFAAIFNETTIISRETLSLGKSGIENKTQIETILYSYSNVTNYPLFNNDMLYILLIIILSYFWGEDTIFCLCSLLKYFYIKSKFNRYKKTQIQIGFLDILTSDKSKEGCL